MKHYQMFINKLYSQIGKSNGHFSNKENRAQKLIDIWDEYYDKFYSFVQRGNAIELSIFGQCALGILIMMETGIRVGNENSAEGYIPMLHRFDKKTKKLVPIKKKSNTKLYSYGLITLEKRHVQVNRNKVIFRFTGKRQVEQNLVIEDSYITKLIKSQLSGKKNTDRLFDISYNDMKKFVHKYVGKKFTIKDFRTAVVNIRFIENLKSLTSNDFKFTKKSEMNKVLSNVIEKTAKQIGHTKSICKKSYISSELLTYVTENFQNILDNNKQ